MRFILFVFAVSLAPAWGSDMKKSTDEGLPIVVHIEKRGKLISVATGGAEARFTIRDESGKTVVSNATLADLKAAHPEEYELVKNALAAEQGTLVSI